MNSALSDNIGELAALGAALCWTGTGFFFEAAGRAIGSLTVNLLRLFLAAVLLMLLGWLVRGQALPTDASAHAWLWLALSGLVGFTFGDLCLFRSFIDFGVRRASLVMSLAPPITAGIGYFVLGESLNGMQIFAIGLTMVGVFVAVNERAQAVKPAAQRSSSRLGIGFLLALGGAVGQAVGLVLSKYGMGGYNALAATQIRIFAGIIGFGVVFTVIGWWPRLWAARKSGRGLSFSAMGALLGPVAGVTLSLYAVQHTVTGVAASIMATPPILVIPVSAIVYGERITARSVIGAVIAVCGVILLFW